MLTVAILINGQPIMARSAVNTANERDGLVEYQVDDGSVITHRPGEGAVALAIKLLGTIKEQKVPQHSTAGRKKTPAARCRERTPRRQGGRSDTP